MKYSVYIFDHVLQVFPHFSLVLLLAVFIIVKYCFRGIQSPFYLSLWVISQCPDYICSITLTVFKRALGLFRTRSDGNNFRRHVVSRAYLVPEVNFGMTVLSPQYSMEHIVVSPQVRRPLHNLKRIFACSIVQR
jgi:hypothetical protein